jgi:para-nitrobenzyl esterase
MKSAALFAFSIGAVTGSLPIVELPDGSKYRGETVGDISAFKGIPFATAPTGNLRWAPPQIYINSNIGAIHDATEYGSACKQTYFDGVEMGSEDCLFLNVWANLKKGDNADLPVAVYIHGGSYMSGAGSDIDGADFVDFWKGNAIVVSMNYRLNVFGFSGSDDLRQQDPESSTGNYGIQDQRMALQWIRNNIGSFGGDENRVMIFGESAGAGSVTNHLAMSKSFEYYSSAALESGSFVEWVTQPLSVAETAYATIAEVLSCTAESPLQCLLNKTTEELYKASLSIKSTDIQYGTPYNPTVDGVELTTHPWIALANGDVADVPILHGTNLDEGSMFLPLPYDATEVQLHAYWKLYFPTAYELSTLTKLYVTGKEDSYPAVTIDGVDVSLYWWAGQRSMADGSFFCAAKYASKELSSQQSISSGTGDSKRSRESSTYTYHFEYLADGSSVPFVQHTAEIPFVFHDNEYMASDADVSVADIMAGYWGAFLIMHDPNGDATHNLTSWPSYDVKKDNLLTIVDGQDVHESFAYNTEECKFFNSRSEASIRKAFPSSFRYLWA